MAAALSSWGKAPLSLRAYVLLNTGVIVVLGLSRPIVPAGFSIVTALVWNSFLIRGIRWLWIATIVLGALTLGFDLIVEPGRWRGGLIGFAILALLVVPPTRRFFQTQKSEATA
jgi:hypothetical protein